MIITYKPQGQTIGQLTNEVRKKLKKKICYIGRLDPIASGITCFLEDDECKLAANYIKFDKTYCFNLILGISTDSADPLGLIKNIKYISDIDEKFIDFFNDFKYMQKYPIYSSFVIKKNNLKKPLWYFAKNNIELNEKEFPIHEVHIKMLEKVGKSFIINSPNYFINQIEKLDDLKGECFRKNTIIEQYKKLDEINLYGIPLIAKVSSGTYIRKLCEDIGNYLNIPAIADSIERIAFHFPEKINNYDIL